MGKWESCSVNTACLKLTSCIIFFLLRAFSFQVSLFLFPKIHCPTAFSPFQPGLHSLSLPLLLPVFPHTALVLASPLLSSPLDTSFPHHSLFCRVSLSPEEITKQNCLRGKAQRTREGSKDPGRISLQAKVTLSTYLLQTDCGRGQIIQKNVDKQNAHCKT